MHTERVFNMAKRVIDKFTDLAGENVDPRTRRYLAPKRIVWTQGDVSGAEHLLEEKSNQITLVVGQDNCTLKNQPGKPHAAILVDFGIEFAGSARFHTWMTHGPGHNGAVKVAVRFGESVMEALTPLGEKTISSPGTASKTMLSSVGITVLQTAMRPTTAMEISKSSTVTTELPDKSEKDARYTSPASM